MDFDEYEGFFSPFRIFGRRIVTLIESSAEKFKGEAVEIFFLVVTDNGQDEVSRLVDIFECKYVNKR